MKKYFTAYKRVVNDRAVMSPIWNAVVRSAGDILLAVFVTMVALLVMLYTLSAPAVREIVPTYILINFLLTMRRVIQRVDYYWTTDEVGERMLAEFSALNEKLDMEFAEEQINAMTQTQPRRIL